MFQPSLQTHFNGRVDAETLRQVRAFGFRWARMDAQEADAWTLQGMIADAEAAGLTPLTIVYDLDRLRAVPRGRAVEWGNEPDGDIAPRDYRTRLDAAAEAALECGLELWAPAISNLDMDSQMWLKWVYRAGGSRWPDGLTGISVHRYGNGTFEWPHRGFASREAEVDLLRTMLDGRPFMVTEFGYSTTPGTRGRVRSILGAEYARSPVGRGLTEPEQAERIGQEWEFWKAQGCNVPFLYQINDPPHPAEGYGVRRCASDGTLDGWKLAAYQVPKEADMDDVQIANVTANTVFAKEDLVEIPGRPGEYGLRCPPGTDTLFSPKPNGKHELRAMDALGGPNETCQIAGDLVYFPMNTDGARFAWRLVG